MASLSMASINTLLKKGYLLAVVIMAANIFVGNEMKAMNKNKTNEIPLAKENEDNNGIKLGESILIEDNDENASCNQYARVFSTFYYIGRMLLTLLAHYFSLVLTTISNGGIIIQGHIGSLCGLVGDLKDF